MFKVSIFMRIREDGKQRYVRPVWMTKTVLKPGWAFVTPGKAEHRPEGTYALRYMWQGKQKWESVGSSHIEATSKRAEREWQINNMAELPERQKPDFAKKATVEASGKTPLDKAILLYLTDVAATATKRTPSTVLIFPASRGGVEGHFLRSLKELALKAGLNCGNCINKKGLSCAEHPVCKHWILHRFRKTFATSRHREGASAFDVKTARPFGYGNHGAVS